VCRSDRRQTPNRRPTICVVSFYFVSSYSTTVQSASFSLLLGFESRATVDNIIMQKGHPTKYQFICTWICYTRTRWHTTFKYSGRAIDVSCLARVCQYDGVQLGHTTHLFHYIAGRGVGSRRSATGSSAGGEPLRSFRSRMGGYLGEPNL
jgi:hypothetical protein